MFLALCWFYIGAEGKQVNSVQQQDDCSCKVLSNFTGQNYLGVAQVHNEYRTGMHMMWGSWHFQRGLKLGVYRHFVCRLKTVRTVTECFPYFVCSRYQRVKLLGFTFCSRKRLQVFASRRISIKVNKPFRRGYRKRTSD